MLYWIKDDLWIRAAPIAATNKGHLCPNCAGKAIGRPLTLNDLAISNYLRTASNMPDGHRFMREYARATIIGGLKAVGLTIPNGWTEPSESPHVDAMEIGKQLALQTADSQNMLPTLIAEVDRCFS
jgi:hypothetical protein